MTTTFLVIYCDINHVTGEYFCYPPIAVTFDLTWTLNGFRTVEEKTKRTETTGPLVTKSDGEFTDRSATVNGTFDRYISADNDGSLLDTKGRTFLREITQAPHP